MIASDLRKNKDKSRFLAVLFTKNESEKPFSVIRFTKVGTNSLGWKAYSMPPFNDIPRSIGYNPQFCNAFIVDGDYILVFCAR